MDQDDLFNQIDMENLEEYQKLSEDLINAKGYFDKNDFLLAINLASDVARQAALAGMPELESSARGFIAETRIALQQQTDENIRLIDDTLKRDDPEKAQEIFNRAIEKDPDNNALKAIEKEINRKFDEIEKKRKLIILEKKLKARDNFGELREVIHEAEKLNPLETFSPELLELYQDAKEYYEQYALDNKILTTILRTGKLKERAKALLEIRNRMMTGTEVWYDEISERDVPIVDAFNDYKESLNELFLHNITDEHEQILKDFLPANPEEALDRLNDQFSFFNSDEYSTLVEEKYLAKYHKINSEIESALEIKKRALSTLAKAEIAGTSPIERLHYAVNAKEIFEYLEDIDSKIDRYKENAANDINAEVNNSLELAQIYIDQNSLESYQLAQELVEKAETAVKNWFLADIPKEISTARDSCNSVRKDLLQRKNKYDQAIKKLERFRSDLADPKKLMSVLEQFEDLRSDADLAQINEIKSFEREIVRKKEKGMLHLDADRAYQDKNWSLLAEICKELLSKDLEQDESEKIQTYYREAQGEILVGSVQSAVRLGDMTTAQNSLDQAVKLNPVLESRLQIEKGIIDDCVTNNDNFAQLFKKAGDLRKRADLESKLKALNIYKFLKGGVFEPDVAFPPYSLNFFIQKAEENANQLSDEIRKEYLLPIVQFVGSSPEHEKRHFREALACYQNSRLLWKYHLITDESDKAKIYEAEKFYAELQKTYADELPDPDQLLQVWDQLKKDYPGNMDVEVQYVEVFIDATIKKAMTLVASGNLKDAIALIITARKQAGLANDMRLPLLLVELLIDDHDYAAAEKELSRIPGNSKYRQSKEELTKNLIQQKELNSWIDDLDEYIAGEQYVEALILLNSMMDNPELKNNSRVSIKQQEIFQKGQSHYYRLAQPGLESNASYNEKIDSVKHLIELGKFEDIIDLPKSKRQSIRSLSRLSQELIEVLPEMLNDLGNIVIDQLPEKEVEKILQEKRLRVNALAYICETLSKNRTLSERAKKEIKNFENNLFEVREQNSKSILNLEKIKPQLIQVSEDQIWETAWRSGNWDELMGNRRQINESGFGSLTDVKNFRERLDHEQKLFDYLNRKSQEIINQFNEDKFEKVCDIFREIRVLPVNIFTSTSNPFFNQQLYEERKQWLDGSLYISDFWGDYKGWGQIEKIALQRAGDLATWENWFNQVLSEKENVDREFQLLSMKNDFENEFARFQTWSRILNLYNDLLVNVNACNEYKVESDLAEEYQTQSKDIRKAIQSNIKQIVDIRGDQPTFPSAEKFREGIRFLNNNEERTLEKLIEEAEKIGPSSQEESDRLANAKNHYNRYVEKKNLKSKSFSQKVVNLFRKE